MARRPLTLDEFTVATMVVPLGVFPEGATLPSGEQARTTGMYYDCRHLLANGDCRIYEQRPKMCRDFPNGTSCPRAGCTFTEDETCRPMPRTLTVVR